MTSALLILTFSLPSVAARYMAFLGGSGDPPGTTTIFDAKISGIGTYAQSSSSQVNIAFDGGHTQTENILRTSFPGQTVTDFTNANYETMITRYETDIRAGNIKPGDQLLLMIDSHGAERNPPFLTHNISSGRGTAVDLNNLSGSDTVSLDRLASLSRLAEEKGIQLGIVDMSCHSGASLPLANSRTCVITASGPQSYAYGGDDRQIFSTRFIDSMRTGRNLEDVFLEARSSSTDPGFAMISTPEGISTQDQLYPILRRYINYSDPKADKFNRDIQQSVATQSCLQENADVQRILELVGNLESVTEGITYADFRSALTDYHNFRRTVQTELERMGVAHLNESRRLCGVPSIGCLNLSLESIIGMDVDARIGDNQRYLISATNDADRTKFQQWITYFQNVKTARDEVLRTYPGIERYSSYLRNNQDLKTKTLELSNRVARESRKIYSALYQKRADSNPCRSFTL